jgi:hypothetical protein
MFVHNDCFNDINAIPIKRGSLNEGERATRGGHRNTSCPTLHVEGTWAEGKHLERGYWQATRLLLSL